MGRGCDTANVRQQRSAGNARLRIGLHDARDCHRNVEVGGLRLLD